MKKSYAIWLAISLLVLVFVTLSDYRFTQESAIKVSDEMPGEVNILSSLNSKDSYYVIYKYKNYPNYIGVSVLRRGLSGLAWRNEQVLGAFAVEEGKPLKTGCTLDEEKYFMIVRVDDPKIKYISIGTTEEDYDISMNDYENRKKVSLDEVKNHPEVYQYSQIADGYAAFIGNDFTQAKYTVRAFDENGKLVADEFYGGGERYIE